MCPPTDYGPELRRTLDFMALPFVLIKSAIFHCPIFGKFSTVAVAGSGPNCSQSNDEPKSIENPLEKNLECFSEFVQNTG